MMAVFYILAIVLSVTVHEFCHAKTADRLGDPTPEAAGRVTLNPKAHLDPLGSILFLLIGFGWGKPVPFDPYNLKNPQKDAAIISLAGPASNFIMAIVCSLFLRLFGFGQFEPGTVVSIVRTFLEIFIWINLVLGTFNLLPFAPLDGFRVIGGILSEKQAPQWYSLERYGFLFLMFFIFPIVGGRSMLDIFVLPTIKFLSGFLIP